MVHALKECWRVLVPDGQLIDMRPRTSNPDLELVLNDSVLVAGQIDDSGATNDNDTVGPALNPMIKVVNLASLIAAPIIVQYQGFNAVTITLVASTMILIWWAIGRAKHTATTKVAPAQVQYQPGAD